MKDMVPLRCATHPHRKSAEYGSHVISNAKSTLYQGLRSGRQAGVLAQGLLQCLAVVAPQPRLGFVRVACEPFVPASRPPNSSWQNALRWTLPEFLMATAKTDSLAKFIAERQDTGNMRTFRLASS